MQIVTRRIEELIPHPKNYRQHPPNQVAALADSLRIHGQPKPVVITAENVILAGHGLVEAATLAGITTLECSVYAGQHPDAYVIADNHTAETSVDDTHALVELLRELSEAEVDPRATGYDEDEIAALLKQFDDATPPAFTPATEQEQGRLDEKKTITCPECGHAFTA